jgi:hypothetical protein
MNDREKSDSRVVPAKLANKTGQPAAELVEERRLTKGNTDQHDASRTQSRDVDASGALGRVRRVAQQDCCRTRRVTMRASVSLTTCRPAGAARGWSWCRLRCHGVGRQAAAPASRPGRRMLWGMGWVRGRRWSGGLARRRRRCRGWLRDRAGYPALIAGSLGVVGCRWPR